MEDITVVTALTGDRDRLHPIEQIEGVKYVCFTDRDIKCEGWEIRKAFDKFDNYLNAKIHKVLIHKFVKTRYSIWLDASVQPRKNLVRMLETFLKEYDIAVYSHAAHSRPEPVTKIEDEVKACIELKKDNPERILEQYKDNKYPDRIPPVCGIIFRRHTLQMERLNEKWWSEICRYSNRDQLSFPYVFHDYYEIGGKLSEDFTINAHNV